MIEIKYKDDIDIADISGSSVAEARKAYQKELRIPAKASAFLNGKKIVISKEGDTLLNNRDRLVFKVSRMNPVAILAGVIILAFAVTGGVFAYGFTNSTTTLLSTVSESDFATVSANTSNTPSWTVRGMQKGQTGPGTLFDISTLTSGYPGNFSATISLTNVDALVSVYRNLNLTLEVRDSSGALVDINGDGFANSADITLLTLQNPSASFNIEQGAPDVYTVKLVNGGFNSNPGQTGWISSGAGTPMLYCEVTQR